MRSVSSSLAAFVFLGGLAAACSRSEPPVGDRTSALDTAQCLYFEANGKVRICHATGLATNPFVLLKISESACIHAHATHPDDYVDVAGGTCNGQGCLPASAPCDATLPCCDGLTCENGACTAVAPIDLGKSPFVWFAPLPPLPITSGRPFVGSVDFMSLFSVDAPWRFAADRVDAFKLYGEWIMYGSTLDERKQVVGDLVRRGIAVAFEAGPLLPDPDGCGVGIEGFSGADTVATINRLREAGAGGPLVWALDEPYYYGSVYGGPGACHWSAETVAVETWKNVLEARAVAPDLIVGEAQPLGGGNTVENIVAWWDAYRAVAGEPLAFVQMDVNYHRPGVYAQLAALENAARARGIPFGLIAMGEADAASDAEWHDQARSRLETFELEYGGHKGNLVYQSWVDRPDFVLPETSPSSFTHLINQYFRPRTSLELAVAAGVASGTARSDGVALSAVDVDLALTDVEGPGAVADVTFAGIVPTTATKVSFATRVNMECDCAHDARFSIYRASYAEGGASTTLPADGNWGWLGTGSVALVPSDDGGGSMLVTVAAQEQNVAQWSPEIAVTGGAVYTAALRARIPPSAAESGFFQLVFTDANGAWVGVPRVAIGPAVSHLVVAADGAGHFESALPVSAVRRRIEARTAPTGERWAGYARVDP